MIEKWGKTLDKNGSCGALLTDLSKAFDCLHHDLVIAKLHAYGFDFPSLKLIYNYLYNRQQRTKIENSYSSWHELIFGVPQGSILGPLLFNIFICDLFLSTNKIDIANYADDTTPYACRDSIDEVLNVLESETQNLFQWFINNGLKVNPDKCHLLLTSQESLSIKVGNDIIKNKDSQKLLGITINSKLNFDEHVNNICKKTNQKLNALSRIAYYMSFDQRKLILNAFILSQFSYCPLVCMNHSRYVNNKINRIHARTLRIIYNDRTSSFEELLEKDNSDTIHHRNLKILATEMFKVKNDLAPSIFNNIFERQNMQKYNLRNVSDFKSKTAKTVQYGTETISFLGPKIWDLVPSELKNLSNISMFKEKIKKWRIQDCPCRLCKQYIAGVGFLD